MKKEHTLWRCYNPACTEHPAGMPGYEFRSEQPTCPKCGLNKDAPEGKYGIEKLVCIHLAVEDKDGPIPGHMRRLRILCSPQMTSADFAGRNGQQHSGNPVAVTCYDCLNHADFPADGFDELAWVPNWKIGRELKERQ